MIKFNRQFDPHKIRLLIFDLDGTLIDSRLDLVHSVNAMLRHFGRPELPDEVVASYVGDGAPMLVRRALGDPRDAWAITERVCGVCTTVHALASVRSRECATRCRITSVSLEAWKIEPSRSNSRRSSPALVMLPLCATATWPLLQVTEKG